MSQLPFLFPLVALIAGILCYEFSGPSCSFPYISLVALTGMSLFLLLRHRLPAYYYSLLSFVFFVGFGGSICHLREYSEAPVTSPCVSLLLERAAEIRERIEEEWQPHIASAECQSLLFALVLGDRSELEQSTKQMFSTTGTSHILAVSGLHVGIVLALFYLLFYGTISPLRTHPVKECLILLLIITYTFITGCSPPVLRAALMITLFIVGRLIRRDQSTLHAVILSAFILLVADPWLLFNISFQLSYAALLGILLLYPVFAGSYRLFSPVMQVPIQVLSISLSAQLGILPFMLYYFNILPCYALLSNLLIFPCVGLLLSVSLCYLLTIALAFLSPVLNQLLEWICTYLIDTLHLVETMPYAVIHFKHIGVMQTIGVAGIELGLLLICHRNKWGFYLLLLSVFLLLSTFV